MLDRKITLRVSMTLCLKSFGNTICLHIIEKCEFNLFVYTVTQFQKLNFVYIVNAH